MPGILGNTLFSMLVLESIFLWNPRHCLSQLRPKSFFKGKKKKRIFPEWSFEKMLAGKCSFFIADTEGGGGSICFFTKATLWLSIKYLPKAWNLFCAILFFVKALPSHTMAFTGFIVEVLKCSAAAKDRMVQTKQGRRCVEGRLFKSFSTIRIGGEFFSEEAILYPTS